MLIQEQKKKEVIMDVRIQAIHFDATAQLEAFIQKKVSKLEQYFDGIILAEVTLKVVKPETVKNKQASIMFFRTKNHSPAASTSRSRTSVYASIKFFKPSAKGINRCLFRFPVTLTCIAS